MQPFSVVSFVFKRRISDQPMMRKERETRTSQEDSAPQKSRTLQQLSNSSQLDYTDTVHSSYISSGYQYVSS
jgi:hypothetical protein